MNKALVLLPAIMAILATAYADPAPSPQSRTITDVMRDPLPSEDLSCSESDTSITIQGPTFRYVVDKATGLIAEMEASRNGKTVAELTAPTELWIDDHACSRVDERPNPPRFGRRENNKVLVCTGGRWGDIDFMMYHNFYNDGLVLTIVNVHSEKDIVLTKGIRYEVAASGRFSHYLHKRRDTEGMDCYKGALPEPGAPVSMNVPTSCLEVFSSEAAIAMLTNRGGSHRAPADIETASLRVDEKSDGNATIAMTQHIVNIAPGEAPFVLRAGEHYRFYVGMAVAPNRLPHPRSHDMRMFIWVGDEKNPYPTDEEILTAAQLGFTMFQMHRVGTPGQPRPPAGEFDRVLKTVHDAGMLFIWTANADLMYASAPEVAKRVAEGTFVAWQGFNYGGKYKASMDSYCDTLATCLASPGGLADYRIQCKKEMLAKYPVDGMYIDDNLPYSNCALWKEHRHPEQVYDCLVELHDMNWKRREALKTGAPHAVLIDHCSLGFILPSISAFDMHLFGEGYSFPSIEAYWDTFGSFKNMEAQGSLFAGDSETTRCGAEVAYTFDLLTGGGQYTYLDWRLWPQKFPYASGVKPEEALFVKTYNLAQYYFGMYESEPHFFATSRDLFTTSAEKTYATIYQNTVWNEALVVLANMNATPATTTLEFHKHDLAALKGDGRVSVYDINQRSVSLAEGDEVFALFKDRALAPNQLQLLYVRGVPAAGVYHQWGGKRISETWDASARKLTLTLHGPVGLNDSVFLATNGTGIASVTVDGAPAEFFVDSAANLAHGQVTFKREPITLEITCTEDGTSNLPIRAVGVDQLTAEVLAKRTVTP
ncbi:MAG: hypothetical protein WC655_22945 [Candidatus Hydrogenedentales bacterium]